MDTNAIYTVLLNVLLGAWCIWSLFGMKFDKVSKKQIIFIAIDVLIIDSCFDRIVETLKAAS